MGKGATEAMLESGLGMALREEGVERAVREPKIPQKTRKMAAQDMIQMASTRKGG